MTGQAVGDKPVREPASCTSCLKELGLGFSPLHVIWTKLLPGTGRVTRASSRDVTGPGGGPPPQVPGPETLPRRVVILALRYQPAAPFCFPWLGLALTQTHGEAPSTRARPSPQARSPLGCSSGHARPPGRGRAGEAEVGGAACRAPPPARGGFSLAESPPQPPSPTLDWLGGSRWAWPAGGRERKESARSREAGLPRRRRGRARGWGREPGLLHDKSAGDCWGPAPRGGEGEGGAGLRAAGPVRTAEAARDGPR